MAVRKKSPAAGRRPARASAPQPGAVRRAAFPIVAIGASAGGLEAIEHFLRHMPADSGIAFIIAQHLDPTQKSQMAELLQRFTAMPVLPARDRRQVEPNTVVVLPPNREITIQHRVIRLVPPSAPHGQRFPIDALFRSLALDQQEESIAVVLSGMGTDGTNGIKIIKEYAGAVFVQEPGTAAFDSMPRSALDTGFVDVVAPAGELPQKIIAYLRHVPRLDCTDAARVPAARHDLGKVLTLLKARTGHDFSLYKKTSLCRRIERRMGLLQVRRIPDYTRLLRKNPRELDLLAKDLLIGVTSFFRDPAAWETLRRTALPPLLAAHRGDAAPPVRAWVTGCATGEEAYSLAIVLAEAMETAGTNRGLAYHIFATDLDGSAIEKARAGFYPASIEADVSPARLRRFFTREGAGYRVNPEIRAAITFAPHNLVMDPPFLRLDILTCRNLLIYFSAELQQKLLPLFHFALNPGGVLMLGTAETIGQHTRIFAPLAAAQRIYRHRAAPPQRNLEFPSAFHGRRPAGPAPAAARKNPGRKARRAAAKTGLTPARDERLDIRQDMQATHEELRSTNEELQAANEELQSTNEELNASKEEMQSINEELQSLNQELRTKAAELVQLNSDLHNFLNSSEVATIFLDADLNIRRFTPSAAHIIKLIPTDIGRPITDLTSNLDYPGLVADVQEVFRTLAVREQTVATRDHCWFAARLLPYRTQDNVISGVVLTFTDITAMKRAEEQLLRAEKMAAIGHLAAGVAHEFNNILNNISICAQTVALEQPASAAVAKTLADVQHQVKRGAEVVESMLTLAAPGPATAVACAVSKLAEDALIVQRQQLELENIALRLDLDPALAVLVRPNRVVQVFLNIILNARHAMQPARAGTLAITAARAGNNISVTFRDTGTGMDEPTRRQIFNPFFTTKGAYAADALGIKGVGLGLTVSYALVQAEGGDITVTSAPGRGTAVTVVLPAAAAAAPVRQNMPAAIAAPAAGAAKSGKRSAGRTVLVVDDEVLIERCLCQFLKKQGFRVTFCSDSRAAAELIAGPARFDVMIFDENMPRLTGSQLARLAREAGHTAGIFMLAGQLEPGQLLPQLESLQVERIFAKPFDLVEISNTLDCYLQNRLAGEKRLQPIP